MTPENKTTAAKEHTEALPAQEKVAYGNETFLSISADQIYAIRAAELKSDGSILTQGYVP